jgi:hypothetical protein
MGGGIPPSRLEAVRDAAATAAHDAVSSRAPLVQYEPVAAAESPAGDSANPHAVLVAEDGAPLRARPEPDAPILSTLDDGSKLVVIAEHGAFYEVITPDDRFGYVAREATYGALSLDAALGRRPGAPDAVA